MSAAVWSAQAKGSKPTHWSNRGGILARMLPRGLEHVEFFSPSMATRVGAIVYCPPQYRTEAERRFPVLYWLHGINGDEWNYLYRFFEDNQSRRKRSLLDTTNIYSLLETGKVEPMIVVFVNGGKTTYYRDRGDQKPETMIVHELIPFIDQSYRTLADRGGRAIEGFSMGGLGALRFGLRYPELFCSVAAYSPIMTEAAAEAQIEELRQRAAAVRGRFRLRIAIGDKDDRAGLEEFVEELAAQRIECTYTTVRGIGHNLFELYQATGLDGLRFHAEAFASAPMAVSPHGGAAVSAAGGRDARPTETEAGCPPH